MKISGDRVRYVLDCLSRLVLGGIFIYAAWSKIQDPALFARSVSSYRLLPSIFVGPFALILPMLELVAGVALVATKWSRESALVLLGLLGLFFIGLTQAAIRGLDISCGCFGGAEGGGAGDSIGAALLRDVLLFVPAVWLVRRPNCWIGALWARIAVALTLVTGGVFALRPGTETLQPAVQPSRSESGGFTATISGDMDVLTMAGTATNAVPPLETVTCDRTVPPEKWTGDFTAALACAQAEQRPIVMVGYATKCEYCARLKKVFASGLFKSWLQGSNIYLVERKLAEANDDPEAAALARFLKETPHAWMLNGVPHIGIYWRRPSGGDLRTIFSGRRGGMPGTYNSSLVVSTLSALEFILGDYLKSLDGRQSLNEMLTGAEKRIQAAVQGSGKVTLTPKSGRLAIGGAPVVITAKPAPGWRLTGWLDPAGKPVKQKSPGAKLTLGYSRTEGTYTAVFQKK